jgi:uncharacterized protein
MRIVVAGASGLVGAALVPVLRAQGHEVAVLVRRVTQQANEIPWNPAEGQLAVAALAGVDAVVNLAGENIAASRWTAARREALRRSRLDSTRTLVAAMRQVTPRPSVLVNASAIGYYGDRGDEVLTEESSAGRGFLPELCVAWEAEALAAVEQGVRVVCLRSGVVLAREGGALAKMLPTFRLGLGGHFGEGRAWMSWVSLSDLVRIISMALADARWRGSINAVAPCPVTNREFAATLGRTLHRPAFWRIPIWGLRLALGEMARETLLASTRAAPRRLAELKFEFNDQNLEPALRHVLVP